MTFPLPKVDYGKDMIWYAAYGSNLSEDRFFCYINGGKPEGTSEEQAGMKDKSPPLLNTDYYIYHELYFADYADRWKGGVAFISPDSSKDYRTYCRIYLIKRQQFIELLSQENRRSINEDEVDFNQLDEKGRFIACSGSWYGLVLNVGEWAGYPIYTFTREDDCRLLNRNRPSNAYLNTIIKGLVECYPYLKNNKLVRYLHNATQGTYSEKDIRTTLKNYWDAYIKANRTDDSLFLVHPTDDRKETAREFILQLSKENQKKLNAKVGDTLIVASTHNGRKFEAVARLSIVDEEPEDHIARIDQKLRVAIGVRKGDWIRLRKASNVGKLGLAKFWEKRIGTQPELMRVHRATFEDMEIPIARIPSSTFEVIGTEPGHFVSIQSTKKATRVRAVPLSMEAWNQRVELMKYDKDYAPNPREVLSLDRVKGGGSIGNDIPPIFMDNDLRNELGITVSDCVRVVRDVKDSFLSRLHLAALPLTFTAIGFAISLEIDTIIKIAIITAGMFLSVFALYIQVKAKVK
jgi:hypothetical protein